MIYCMSDGELFRATNLGHPFEIWRGKKKAWEPYSGENLFVSAVEVSPGEAKKIMGLAAGAEGKDVAEFGAVITNPQPEILGDTL